MSPAVVTALIPVVRELWGLGEWIADRVRARRAKRRAKSEAQKQAEANRKAIETLRAPRGKR